MMLGEIGNLPKTGTTIQSTRMQQKRKNTKVMILRGETGNLVRSRVVYSRSRAVSSTTLPWQYRRRALYLDGRVRDPLHSGSRIFLMLFFFEMNAGAFF